MKETYEVIWYNLNTEVKRDNIDAESGEEAIDKAYESYGGADHAPAKLVTAVKKGA
jgi:hypothetical protein